MLVNSEQAVADRYRTFSWQQARGQSDAYEELTARISQDADFCDHLSRSLPAGNKQQPNLLLAAVRYLDGPYAEQGPRGDAAYRGWREWTLRHWDEVRDVVMRRSTQTNEPARCATLLPLLLRLPQPLALIEVGASAGLCLYPDRYRYRYDDRTEFGAPDSAAVFPCRTNPGTPVPDRLPDIAWRAGVDLNPLDPADPEDIRWLQALIWPAATDERARRQLAAVEAVRTAPRAKVVRGDLVDELPALAAQAPPEATLVVFHTAVLTYLPLERRERFAEVVRNVLAGRARPGHWVSNEHHSVLPWIPTPATHRAERQAGPQTGHRAGHQAGSQTSHRAGPRAAPRPRPDGEHLLTLALDERPVALTGQHGQSVHWL
ncbi:DUF2332 domain-containing protein [Streptomyces sp. MST-110588]|uniref:DUF2332 domain-containing protein n=1 Tax=Streptomyces sp. MST-110588 TaxID=2833628 RepID=UPI001F5E0854|nr:DUF2332 domain-containing protein [Streptomyces sp. MST-110588]UNO41190.1 DUF2332 domain-containing protein [Streptomyces sp. MST-110588]